MGRIAWNEGKYRRCKECKWLIGRKSSVGIECMQPDNQEKWETHPRYFPDGRNCTARLKAPSGRACKRFEPIEDSNG